MSNNAEDADKSAGIRQAKASQSTQSAPTSNNSNGHATGSASAPEEEEGFREKLPAKDPEGSSSATEESFLVFHQKSNPDDRRQPLITQLEGDVASRPQEFRPSISERLGLRSSEFSIPLTVDDDHSNTFHVRVLAPAGMNVQDAALFHNTTAEKLVPNSAYSQRRHHERAVFYIFSSKVRLHANTSDGYSSSLLIKVRFDPNRADFLFPLSAIVALSTFFSFIALMTIIFVNDAPKPVCLLPGCSSLRTTAWNSSFSAFLIAPLSIALVFFGRREESDMARRIYSIYRILFFVLVALSSVSAATMALLQVSPFWRTAAYWALLFHSLFSGIFLTFIAFHLLRIEYMLKLRSMGIVNTFTESHSKLMDDFLTVYFCSVSIYIILLIAGIAAFSWNPNLGAWYLVAYVAILMFALILVIRQRFSTTSSKS